MITGSQNVIAPVADDPEDRLRAVALLPEPGDDAEDGRQRDQVEQHRLDRQQQRPERAHQQHERDERRSARARTGSCRTRRGSSPARSRRCRPRPTLPVGRVLDGGADGVDHLRCSRCRSSPRPGRRRRPWSRPCCRRRPPCGRRARRRAAVIAAAAWSSGTSTAIGVMTPSPTPPASSDWRVSKAGPLLASDSVFDWPIFRPKTGAMISPSDDQRDAGRDPATADDEPRPRRPAAGGDGVVPDPRPVHPRPDLRQDRRQQGEHHRRR